jgi:hypothetical protein
MQGDSYVRGDVLAAVIRAANLRLDGELPLDVDGVEAVFDDIDDLVGALLLRWHTRLAAHLEQALFVEPMDLEAAVNGAWRTSRRQLAGVRLVIDRLTENPPSPNLAAMLRVTAHKDWALMAIMAGLVSYHDESAVPVGRRLEGKARHGEPPLTEPPRETPPTTKSLLARIKAAFAA